MIRVSGNLSGKNTNLLFLFTAASGTDIHDANLPIIPRAEKRSGRRNSVRTLNATGL